MDEESRKSFNSSSVVQPAGSISEGKLDPELDLARRQRRIQLAKTLVPNINVITVKVRMVEEVEKLGSELNPIPLLEAPVLRE